jgi:phosphohistidine phosphatase
VKQLLILRHANAQFHSPTGSDQDRPLSPRGHKQCKQLAQWFETEKIAPQITLCSPATRTRETLAALPAHIHPDTRTTYPRELYFGGPTSLTECVTQLPASAHSALIIGHNPTLSDVVSEWIGAPLGLSTCTLAIVEFETDDWQWVGACPATLRERIRGKA